MPTQLTKQTTPRHRYRDKVVCSLGTAARPKGPKQYTVVAWYNTEPSKPEGHRVFKWSAVVGAGNIEEAMAEGFAAMDIGVDDVLSVEIAELLE